jgi:hypothetical protein
MIIRLEKSKTRQVKRELVLRELQQINVKALPDASYYLPK